MARQAFTNWYRGYLVDHHSPDPPVVTLDELDPAEYIAAYERANLDHVMLYCKDHWGVTYYDTAVSDGKMHPGLKFDFIGEMVRLTQKKGMGFIAYYSVGFDTRAVTLHPDWAVRAEDGTMLRASAHPPRKWHWVCKVSPYAEYALAQIEEILERYQPQALFLDIYHQPFCYCQYCQRAYFERYGRLPPRGEEVALYRREMQDFRDLVYHREFLLRVVSLRDQFSPETAISLNGGHSIHRHEVLDLCDFTYSEPWGTNWLSGLFARGTGKYCQIGPGNLGEVYDPPSERVYVAELASIVANGCRAFAFSGSQHPDGTLDQAEFQRLGAAYDAIEQLQPYMKDAVPVPSVGILFSEKTRLWGESVSYRAGIPVGPHLDGVEGAMRAATYSRWPVDVLPEWRLSPEALRQFQVLLAPNVSCMSAETAQAIRDFVASGGCLMATSDTSLLEEDGNRRDDFLLADVFGCHYIRTRDEYAPNCYGTYLERKPGPFWEETADTQLPTSPPFLEVQAEGSEILATHTLPAVILTDSLWVNWWSPPPKDVTEHPAVLINRYGAGKALYFSFDLFGMVKDGFIWPSKALGSALRLLAGSPPVLVSSPVAGAVLASYFTSSGSRELVVHEANATVSMLRGEVQEITGNVIHLDGTRFQPRSATVVWPETLELTIRRKDGAHVIVLPPLGIHRVVSIKLQP